MNKFMILLRGEIQRLIKYKVLPVSLFVALIWFLFLVFIENNDVFVSLLPMIIILDTTVMAMLYTGAVLFFEKSESTASTMLVTPVSYPQLIWSKAIAGVIQTLLSTGLIILAFYLIKHMEVNLLILIPVLVFTTLFHTFIGFIATYITKDFTSLLVVVMIFSIVLAVPSILNQLNLVFQGDTWNYILLITPTKSALVIAAASFGAEITVEFWISLSYMVIGSLLIYQFAVLPHFKNYVLKQGGI